jgi:phage-related baseplate assembly protein
MAESAILKPIFIATDPLTILNDSIDLLESTLGKTLEPAQVERLLANAMAYREALTRMAVQLAGEQNLVAFATGTNLEALAALFAVTRLVNVAASATVRFTLSAISGTDTAIPLGTRVKTKDGFFIFAVAVASKIAAGQLFADVACTCSVGGTAANDYTAGNINQLLDPIAGVATAVNTTTSAGGVDTETDDALRARVQVAPYRLGTAGSYGAYRFWALSVGAWVIDAKVTSPTPGNVQVAILTNTGTPTGEQLAAVEAALTADTVRPITDTVDVVAANRITFTVAATLTIYTGGDSASILAAAELAVQALVATRRAKLGLDITPGQVAAAILSVAGIYDLALTQPAAPVVATDADWLDCTAITLSVSGSADG